MYFPSAFQRGVAQPGSAPALGAGGRRFESSRPDPPWRNRRVARTAVAVALGAPSRARTCDIQLRRLALYPAELWARCLATGAPRLTDGSTTVKLARSRRIV